MGHMHVVVFCNGSFAFRLGDELEYEEEVLCSGIRICNGDFYYVLLVSVTREYESSSDQDIGYKKGCCLVLFSVSFLSLFSLRNLCTLRYE
jgi:hypothetical protein